MSVPEHRPGQQQPTGKALAGLALGALGVVFGDIGTSPLYGIKEGFSGPHAIAATPEHILGFLSLVFWSLVFVIAIKYLGFVLRADNNGEGGILALTALVSGIKRDGRVPMVAILLGLFGAALLYGDGVITPAISVLGAMEGLSVVTPALERYVPWVSAVILAVLFLFQKHGTGNIGKVFGPVILVWFITISLTGVRGILIDPSILRAVNPLYALDFFLRDGLRAFLVLGTVVLVITGGEALYADMGHFGRRPIRVAWFSVAMPALMINYFGQSALVLHDPQAAENPFYRLAPEWALWPLIVIATAAAIVASQALISGAFSLTQQAIQLGYSPRMTIVHTSSSQVGQIYLPEVNKALAVGCIVLTLGFRSTSNLAAAYGIAVTGTMVITTLLFHRVMTEVWNWPAWRAGLVTGVFLVVDLSFFGANIVKIGQGGWVPIAVAGGVFALMSTWKRGRAIVRTALREGSLPLDLFIPDVAKRQLHRVPGTAVFMTSDAAGAPPVLLHHIKHNKVLHQRVVIMSFTTRGVPHVPREERLEVRELGEGFWVVVGHNGFMETPDLSQVREGLAAKGLELKPAETSYYLGRETLLPTGSSKLARWRKKLFIVMSRNAQSATAFFGLPPNRVVELGAQIQL
ncbi:MAG TPA: potassium transporter Kup [Gemmatimonadales bacterium]